MKYWIKYAKKYGYEFDPVTVYQNGQKVQIDFENAFEAFKTTIHDLWVYDSDTSGETEHIAIVHDEHSKYSYFLVIHSWWWQDGRFQNDFCITQELSYDELTDQQKSKVIKDRDWIQLSRFSHIKWPREM